jgi:hypothetical protein
MKDTDTRDLADRLDEEADDLEYRGAELGRRIEDVGRAWAQKRSDPKVPGAPPDDDDEDVDWDDDDSDDEHGEGWDDPDEHENEDADYE